MLDRQLVRAGKMVLLVVCFSLALMLANPGSVAVAETAVFRLDSR